MAQVESTSDERTVNNTMRHQYRTLSEAEKAKTKIEEAVMWAVKHITG